MAGETILSVRGDARHTVAPDYVLLRGALAVPPATRRAALDNLRAGQDQLIAALTQLGGVPLTVDTQSRDLTWSFGSVGVHDEHDHDKTTGRHGPTGQVLAQASLLITVRALTQLAQLSDVLAAAAHLNLNQVQWRVDAENPAWQVVRADAIRAALAKADDYAAAIGATVTSIDHVADAGLLTPDYDTPREMRAVAAMALGSHGNDGVPTLDPVPQEISATIEARVTSRANPPASNT